jgi:hypothetical protein
MSRRAAFVGYSIVLGRDDPGDDDRWESMTTATVPGGSRGTISTRRAQRLVSFAGTSLLTLCLWIGAPASASAIVGTSCTGLDASCLTQGVRNNAVEVTRTGGDAVKDIGRVVDDTVEGTIDAVERVVGTAESPGMLARGGGAGGGGPGEGNHGGNAPHRGNDHVGGRSGRSRSHVSSARQALVLPIPSSSLRSSSLATGGTGDSSVGAGADGSLGVGRIAAEMGRRLALPLAFLLTLVAIFVAMQSRLDRDDPRLHLASLDEEVSRFR